MRSSDRSFIIQRSFIVFAEAPINVLLSQKVISAAHCTMHSHFYPDYKCRSYDLRRFAGIARPALMKRRILSKFTFKSNFHKVSNAHEKGFNQHNWYRLPIKFSSNVDVRLLCIVKPDAPVGWFSRNSHHDDSILSSAFFVA